MSSHRCLARMTCRAADQHNTHQVAWIVTDEGGLTEDTVHVELRWIRQVVGTCSQLEKMERRACPRKRVMTRVRTIRWAVYYGAEEVLDQSASSDARDRVVGAF